MEHKIYCEGSMEWEFKDGKKIPVVIQDKLTDIFLKKYCEVHSLWVDIFNAHINDWNADFNKIHPNLDGYSKEYNEFIMRKEITKLEHHKKFFKGKYWEWKIVLKYDKKRKYYYPAEILSIGIGNHKVNGQFFITKLDV